MEGAGLKIAISQIAQVAGNDQHRMDNQITEGMQMTMDKCLQQVEFAGKNGCALICFPQWFVGFGVITELPNQFTDNIAALAKQYKINVVTGTLRTPGLGMKSRQCSAIINDNGEFMGIQEKKYLYSMEEQWFLNNEELTYFDTSIGRIVINHGDDCVAPDIYVEVKKMKPDILVLQTNDAVDVKKYLGIEDELRNVIKARAKELQCTICVPMLNGEFMHVGYHGESFVSDKEGNVKVISAEKELMIVNVESM